MGYRNEDEHIVGSIYRLIESSVYKYEEEPSILDFFEEYLNGLTFEDRELDVLVGDSYKIIEALRRKDSKRALHYLDLIKARDLSKIVKNTVLEYKNKGRDHEDTKRALKFLEVTLNTLKEVNKTKWFSGMVRDCHMIYDGLTINNLARVTYALNSIESGLNYQGNLD